MPENQGIGPVRTVIFAALALIAAPYAVLYMGFTDPEFLRSEFDMSQGQLYMVMAIAAALALLFTYVLRKAILVIGVVAALAYGLFWVYTSLDEKDSQGATKSVSSLRKQCVELILQKGEMDRTEAVGYCNAYYK